MRATDEIIAGRVASVGEPAHHRYVVTLFGLYAQEEGLELPISKIVELLEEVNVESTSTRSAVSRLKKREVLDQVGTGQYRISPAVLSHFRRRDERIYQPRVAAEDGRWLLISFTVPESARQARHLLRSGMQRMGFGTISAGLWVAPEKIEDEARDYFEEHDLTQYIEMFAADYLDEPSLPTKVARWWNLESIESHYQDFLTKYQQELGKWQKKMQNPATEQRAREAFAFHLPMFTQWRVLPFLDPGLPASVLPETWKGYQAHELFTELHALVFPEAQKHIAAVLATN